MARMTVTVSDAREKEFRETAAKKFGFKRGSVEKAVDEAFKEWVAKNGK